MNIAVVGAGVAGLSCSRILSQEGHSVKIFDKGRFAGGRLASRTRDENQFDYGAQYFTVKNERFESFLHDHIESGAVSLWDGRVAEVVDGEPVRKKDSTKRYTANPYMRSLAELIFNDKRCNLMHQIESIQKNNSRWSLNGSKRNSDSTERFSHSDADYLVLNMPPAQIQNLIDINWLHSIELSACIAGMYTFDSSLNVDADCIFVNDSIVSWAARDSSKLMRPGGERWVLHASPEWSRSNYDRDDRLLTDALLEAFLNLLQIPSPEIDFSKCHRWKFAKPEPALNIGCHFDTDLKIGFCGDWCNGARVEGAFVSGELLAEKIIDDIKNESV